jgi:hypothetical protein
MRRQPRGLHGSPLVVASGWQHQDLTLLGSLLAISLIVVVDIIIIVIVIVVVVVVESGGRGQHVVETLAMNEIHLPLTSTRMKSRSERGI